MEDIASAFDVADDDGAMENVAAEGTRGVEAGDEMRAETERTQQVVEEGIVEEAGTAPAGENLRPGFGKGKGDLAGVQQPVRDMNRVEGDVEFESADEVLEEAKRRMSQKILEISQLKLIAEKLALS